MRFNAAPMFESDSRSKGVILDDDAKERVDNPHAVELTLAA